jgi:spermidine synthase
MRRGTRLLVYALFLLSGATALVYQVTWLRDLALIFGASHQATSIVLASFMGGLALGGFVFGRCAQGFRHPLRIYGVLEIGIGLFALALPSLLRSVDAFYVDAALRAGEVTTGLTLMRIALAFGVLVLPTFLMGATLPVLIRFIVHRYGELGVRLAWLYGINTLGAAAGALAAGFVMMPALGVGATQMVAVVVNLVIGAVAIAADRGVAAPAAAGVASEEPKPEQAAPDLGDWPTRLAFQGTAVSGLSALALEVMWTRSIALSVGSTTYSFTVMLAAFLVGIWLGSWIHAAFPLRRVHESVQFGAALVVIGVTSFAASQWIPRLPELVLGLNLLFYEDLDRVRMGTTLGVAFAVMLVPCIFMGIAFPLAGQARARLTRGFGKSVGDTLSLNTLGAIVGSLLAGFALIPGMGLQRGMLTVAMLDVAYGLVVLAAATSSRFLRWRLLFLPAVAAAFLLILVAPRVVPPWDLSMLGSFTSNQLRAFVLDGEAHLRDPARRVVYFKEGHSATVSVVDNFDPRVRFRYIVVNGKSVASDLPSDLWHELMLGHIPVLLHPDPKSALVVGLGAGITLGSIAAHSGFEELVLVEIEPAVFGGAALFAHVNDDVLNDPRLEVMIQDGRNYLKTTPRRFDVITADPIHPWTAGSVYLYTTEYYHLASQRLKEGGVMCQWLPVSDLSIDDFRSLIRSFSDNFEHVSVWDAITDVVLIGSRQPIRLDLERLSERIAEPAVKRQLDWIQLGNPIALLSRLSMEDSGIRAFGRDGIVNSDDNLYIEFSAPRAIGDTRVGRNILAFAAYSPTEIELVSNWAPFFGSAREGTAAVQQFRRDHAEEESQANRRRLRKLRDVLLEVEAE